MGYESALIAAGAEVLEFKYFGSYQGDWWAKVHYNGQLGWVHGSYGSCSGCDAFEAEFAFDCDDGCEKHRYDPKEDCRECNEEKTEYERRLKAFGLEYLDNILSQKQAEEYASKNLGWDFEAKEMLEWLKNNSIPEH